MIKVAKILGLSLLSTSSLTAVVVPAINLNIHNEQTLKDIESIPVDPKYLDIDENHVLHGFTSDATPAVFMSNGYNQLVIPSDVVEIAPYAFAYRFDYMSNLITSVDFSQATALRAIGDSAFNYCYALECDLDFQNHPKLAYIGASAFFYCTGIKSVKFYEGDLDNPLVIENHAFASCASLEEITLHDKIDVGNNAFEKCIKLNKINLFGYASLPTWLYSSSWVFNQAGTKASVEECEVVVNFANTSYDTWCNVLYDRQKLVNEKWNIRSRNSTTKDSFNYDENGAITGLKSGVTIDALFIPEDVTKILPNAFQNDSRLNKKDDKIPLILHNKIQAIGSSAFEGCVGLYGPLNLPVQLKELGEYAFKDCRQLSGHVTIPFGITTISKGTFEGSGISGVKFHSEVADLKARAFANCRHLSWIDVSCFDFGRPSWEPQSKESDQPFYGLNSNGSIILFNYVSDPAGFKEGWCSRMISLGMNQSQISKTGDDVKQWTFHFNTAISTNALPDNAFNSIDKQHIMGLKSKFDSSDVLKQYGQINLPSTTVAVEKEALKEKFIKEDAEWTLSINEGLTAIEESGFEGNTGIYGDISIPATLTNIKDNAFKNCSNLQGTLNFNVIPKSHLGMTIGDGAFVGTNFSRIVMPHIFGDGGMKFGEGTAFYITSTTKIIDFTTTTFSEGGSLPMTPWIKFDSNSSGTILVSTLAQRTIVSLYLTLISSDWNSEKWPVVSEE
ncbi:MAG: leucine-rich repeat protein [Mycoplasma sp.]|nr:leucine-rich repeat protein [Candidatus Hennigella equi]